MTDLFKNIELNPAQSEFIADDTSKSVAFVTGYGGGKSFSLVLKMIVLKLQYPKVDILYTMPVFANFRDILIPLLEEITEGTNIQWTHNKSTGEIFFGCGGRVILKSMDDANSIVGFNCGFALIDEIDILTEDKARNAFLKVSSRARVKLPDGRINSIYLGTTPEGKKFVYKTFKKDPPKNYRLIQASSRLNPYLSEEYFENILAIAPTPEIARAYIDGEFVVMTSGAVYPQFDQNTCDSDAIYKDGEELFIGVDFNVRNTNCCI